MITGNVLGRKDGIRVDGYYGTWYIIDEKEYNGKMLYLLEHEEYGDEAASIIVDGDGKVQLDDVWNGFDDYEEFIGLYAEEEEIGDEYYNYDELTVDTMYDMLRDIFGVSEETLTVVTNINGYSKDTMHCILYAVSGYRNFEQAEDEYGYSWIEYL